MTAVRPTTDRRSAARSRRHRLLVVVIALVAPLVLLELSLRGMVAAGWLTDAPSRDTEIDAVLLGLATAARQDVLLMGDSLVRRGVDPGVLASLIEESTGSTPRVASVAQLDVDIRSMLLLARQLGRMDRLPDTMVVGLSMGNYGGSRADPGMRAIERSPMGAMAAGCDGWRTPVPWVECILGQASVAWRWRGEPARLLRAVVTRGTPGDMASEDGTLRPDGFEVTGGRTQEELEQLLATRYRGRVVNITPARIARSGSALREFLGYLRSQGVQVVLFTVPYPPPLLRAMLGRFPEIAAQDTAALEALSAAAGLPIHRMDALGDWWTPAASSDLKHLSASGAAAFTRQLWDEPAFRGALLAAIDLAVAPSTAP